MSSSMSGYKGASGAISGNKIPSGYKLGQIQQFGPEQMQLFKQLFAHAGPESYLSRLASGDESFFKEMEAPALRQFQGQLGNLASRFSGTGMGARRSSGFQQASTSAASNFAQELQSQRQGLQRQALMDLMGISQSLLGQRPYEKFLVQKQQKQNPWTQIAGKFAGAIPGALAGFMTGGPAGAAIGAGSSFLGSSGYNALPGLEDQFRTGQAYL